jgi:uracil-DNA glycosylase
VKREEAVLRELNLYPLWKRRDGGGTAGPDTATSAAAEPAPPAAPPEPTASATPRREAAVMPAAAAALELDAGPVRAQRIGALPWPELKTLVRDCTACRLRAGCTQTVFGVGDERADWLFVGEGPGADEDAQGAPFVGQAGKLLDNMLLAIRLKRGDNVYIANVVKCRPPDNRAPEADEIATCLPYLQRQIALIQPRVIVALGKTAANALLGREATLGSLRGRVHDYHGTPLVITYHPAYLLRTPQDKAKAWEDLKLAVSTARSA